MNCDDVDRALSEASPLPLQAREHVQSCDRCRKLVSALDTRAPSEPPSPATLRQITEGLATNLRPVRPLAHPIYFLGAFLGIFMAIVALAVYRIGALALTVLTPIQFALILSVLAICTCLLAYSLVQQMAPGSLHRMPPDLLPVFITIAVAVAIILLFRFQQEQDFWGSAWWCIRAGTPIGALAAVPLWLILRRGAILSPSVTGAATGFFAGLAGTTALELHCPNLDAAHILVSHLGVAILCALAGFVIGRAAEISEFKHQPN